MDKSELLYRHPSYTQHVVQFLCCVICQKDSSAMLLFFPFTLSVLSKQAAPRHTGAQSIKGPKIGGASLHSTSDMLEL